MYSKMTIAALVAVALLGFATPGGANGSSADYEYVASNTGAGVAFCGLTGVGVASACFEIPSGTTSVSLTILDEVSNEGVLIKARILAPSGNIDSDQECGAVSLPSVPADGHTIYVWVYGPADSLAADCGTGGVKGVVTATFA